MPVQGKKGGLFGLFSPKEAEEEGGGEEWQLTYGDMMTLILCFFVLLFAMSETKTEKFVELMQSMRRAIGRQEVPEAGTRVGLTMIKRDTTETQPKAVDELGGVIQEEMWKFKGQIEEFIIANKLAGMVKCEVDERGAHISISDEVLFPSARATLYPKGNEIIEKLSEILKQLPYRIKVEGHTDNFPIHTEKFPSNWELSTHRACTVARKLIELGIPPERLCAEGFAEFRPVASNDTEEGRAKNRRVEIGYLREEVIDALGEQKKEVEPEPEGKTEN